MKNKLLRNRRSYSKILGVSIIALFMLMTAVSAVVLFATPVKAGTQDTTPPIQTIQLGEPIIEDVYDAGGNWLDLIGTQTPVWINSSDPESGSAYITYTLFWNDHFGDWQEGPTYTVEDNLVTSGNQFLTDVDDREGYISVKLHFDQSCFHQIHALCFNNAGLSSTTHLDFLVDADAPSNEEYDYVGPTYYVAGNVRYISHRTVKRIYANDTGCTGGVAGVCRIEWKVEDINLAIIANGIVSDDIITYYDNGRVNVTGDLDPTPGKMVIEIRILEDCEHYIYHQAFQYNRVDTKPPVTTKTHPEVHGFMPIEYEETIDFEDLTHREYVGTHYPGLTFSSNVQCLKKPDYDWIGYPPHSGDCVIADTTTGIIRIDFDFIVNKVGGWFCTDDTTVELKAYDESGTLLDSTTVQSGYYIWMI
jgi:hypothetical protein